MPDYMRSAARASLLGATSENLIQRALKTIRRHLGMEVAYFSQIVDGNSILRRVDAPGLEHMVKVGDSYPLQDIYCGHVLEGRLPEMMANTANEALARSMPITEALPIGCNISIPIKLKDGSVYGMFCALSRSPNESLNERDLETMNIFADLVAQQVNDEVQSQIDEEERIDRVHEIIDRREFHIVYQPIWNFGKSSPIGFEALCRFTAEPYRTPDVWFQEAASVGLGVGMELAVIEKALLAFPKLPDKTCLTFNISPKTVLEGGLKDLLGDLPPDRLVLEITEHAPVEDYALLRDALQPLREHGLRLAIDDAGAGYASLHHIVQLAPDVIKIDMSLTRDVDTDAARRALATALIYFGEETGATILAEGIETIGELESLKALGIHQGQGYLLGKPAAIDDALQMHVPAEVETGTSRAPRRAAG